MGGGREEQELDAATGEGEGSINGAVLPVLMRRDTVSNNTVVCCSGVVFPCSY